MTALIHFLWRKKIGKSLPPRRFKKSFYQGSSRTFDHLKAKVRQIPQKCFTWTKELRDTCAKDIQELGGVDRTVTLHACKVIKYRIGFQIPCWIPNSRCRILDSLSVELEIQIPLFVGFRVPWVELWIPKAMLPDSAGKTFPEAKLSEFRNPDYLTWSENSILKMIKGKVKSIPSVFNTVKPP